ncbi:MAG: hypothetical protein OXG24_09405 [Gammaproteobacteria bacterium]|nr:hypothetical protein [Gammaproteobacteria bacterium]
MSIESIDHVALPIQKVDEVLSFYESVGFRIDTSFAPRLYSAHVGQQKINFHHPSLWKNSNFTLRGPMAKPGGGDLCFVWSGTANALERKLHSLSILTIEGPVERMGGRSFGSVMGKSYYVRDPDQNLIEFIIYPSED